MSYSTDLCREKGWGPGTRLEGDEGWGPSVIEIRFVGEEVIVAKRLTCKGLTVSDRECGWTLMCRDWREVEGPGMSRRGRANAALVEEVREQVPLVGVNGIDSDHPTVTIGLAALLELLRGKA